SAQRPEAISLGYWVPAGCQPRSRPGTGVLGYNSASALWASSRAASWRSLMTDLAQEVAHAGVVLQIPRGQVRWQPLDLKRSGVDSPRAPALEWTGTRRDRPSPPPAANHLDRPVGRIAVERHVHPVGPPAARPWKSTTRR